MKRIYFDYAAATPIDPEVFDIFEKTALTLWANPNGIHQEAQEAKGVIESARLNISKILNCKPKEIFFCGSATEANNLAIQGTIFKNKAQFNSQNHILISPIEHASVEETVKMMESLNLSRYSVLKIDGGGLVDLESIRPGILPQTVLISIIWVNNEIGTIQPIEKIVKIIREINLERISMGLNEVIIHTDASQAFLYNEINLQKLGVDMLTLSSHKIYSPRGAAILYVKNGLNLQPILGGGDQESGLRSGTQNTSAIVAMAESIKLYHLQRNENMESVKKIQNFAFSELYKKNQDKNSALYQRVILNGIRGECRSVNNINFSLKNIDHQSLHTALDLKGFSLSGGSSCNSGSLETSSVIQHLRKAQGQDLPEKEATLRITFGKYNSISEVNLFFEALEQIVTKLSQGT